MTDQRDHMPKILRRRTSAALVASVTALFAAFIPAPGGATSPPSASSAMAFWMAPAKPFAIVGPIYYVGTRGLGVYLITTPAGHILIDAGLPQTSGDIAASIEALGFKVGDIRILLVSHGHYDHAGGLATLKAASGAALHVMDGDAAAVETGGKFAPIYRPLLSRGYPPVKVDRILKDGDTVALGGVTLTARLGAGHTAGATTWVTDVPDGGRTYRVVFPCCTGLIPGVVLSGTPVADQFRRTFAMLESLTPDIALPAHTETFDFELHHAHAIRSGIEGWLDRGGSYSGWVAGYKAEFEATAAADARATQR